MDFAGVFSGQPVLITGGMGFIGSNLARRLVELGARVTLTDLFDPGSSANEYNLAGIRGRVKYVHVDIGDNARMAPLIQKHKFMFNLAGQSSHMGSMLNPLDDLNINAVSQLNLLETCRLNNPEIRIVFAGTRQVYGKPRYLPVDENHLLTPLDYNGVSKRAGEMYHIVHNRIYGMWTSILRLTNVYGPRMRVKDSRLTFIGWWFSQILKGNDIEIFGDGMQIRDLNYVDDVVDAFLLCAVHPTANGAIYNLGGKPTSLLELARLLIEVNGGGRYSLVAFPEDRKIIDIGDYFGDYSRIQQELNWSPSTELRAGIAKTLAFYRKHGERYF